MYVSHTTLQRYGFQNPDVQPPYVLLYLYMLRAAVVYSSSNGFVVAFNKLNVWQIVVATEITLNKFEHVLPAAQLEKATVISTVVYMGKVELEMLCILCAVRICARQVTFMDFHGINCPLSGCA